MSFGKVEYVSAFDERWHDENRRFVVRAVCRKFKQLGGPNARRCGGLGQRALLGVVAICFYAVEEGSETTPAFLFDSSRHFFGVDLGDLRHPLI